MTASTFRHPLQSNQLARFAVVLVATLGLLISPGNSHAMNRAEAVTLSRKYLASDDDDERQRISRQLARYEGAYAPVIRDLQSTKFEPMPAGYLPEENFTLPDLLEKHPDDLLYFTIPKSYHPDRPTGLIIFMHGGGRSTSRYAPRYSMDFAENSDQKENSQLGDLFDATNMIAVGPSAPDKRSYYRWCLRESDEYLADVIRECKSRFNIDDDRVLLLGHSMGGFGAYHHVQRQPDRFAAVIVNAGSWWLAHWPVIRGTPLFIVHGVNDAVRGERWHHTDIEHARWTDKLLSQQKLDYTYYEHEGEHGIYPSRKHLAICLKAAGKMRRDPYAPHVVLASPLGFDDSYCFPVKHNRWITLDEATDGEIEYDELVTNGADDFDDWRLRHRMTKSEGASIDAVNRGDNTIAVTTLNVARFTLWLHPRMVDVKTPVTVTVNGKTRFSAAVKTSLTTALESYSRRDDWGLIYPIKIELAPKE